MICTNQSYINEYKAYDSILEFINESTHDIQSAVENYNFEVRKYNAKRPFYEAIDDGEMNQRKDSILAKIGKAVVGLVEKIAQFLKSLADKFLKNDQERQIENDIAKVTRMMADYPDLKKEIIRGINSEWFTYGDIAKYEHDIAGLYKMIEDRKYEKGDILDKANVIYEKYIKTKAPVILGLASGAVTVMGLIKSYNEVKKSFGNGQNATQNSQRTLGLFGRLINRLRGGAVTSSAHDIAYGDTVFEASNKGIGAEGMSSVYNILSKCVTICIAETKNAAMGRAFIARIARSYANSSKYANNKK